VEPAPLASLDGTVVPLAEARIPVTDPGLLRGDGVFEVVRLYGGRPFALDEHLGRMERSAAGLRLEVDVADVAADAAALIEAARPGDAMLRLVITRDGHRLALLEPVPDRSAPATLGFVEYVSTRVLDGIKSLSYGANMLATRLAQERGFEDALLVTPHGRVLEAPTATIFVVADGRIRTPPLSERVLESITRRAVLQVCEVEEAVVTVADLRDASAAFLASTTREVQPISRIEQLELDPDDPLVIEARERVREHILAVA
jgi:branched-chain amino acid aminotransferase